MPLPSFKLPAFSLSDFPGRRIITLIAEAVMATMALAVLLIVLVVGRLMYGPLTATSLTPWVERALSMAQSGIHATVEESMLHWDKEQRHIVLNLGGVKFLDMLDQKVADVPQVVAVFTPLGYFGPSHSPWMVKVRQPQLHLRIDSTGTLRLGALQAGETNILEKDEDTPLTADGLRGQLHDLVKNARHAAFGLFSNVSVEDAGITLIDEPRNESWHFNIPEVSMKRLGRDQEGVAIVHILKGSKAADLGLNLHYDGGKRIFSATLSFKDLEPEMLAAERLPFRVVDYMTSRMSGNIVIAFDDDLNVQTGELDIALSAGQIIIPAYYPAPLEMKKADLKAVYTAANRTLTLEPVRIELDKALVGARATVKFEPEARTVALQIKLANLKLEDLPTYWPEKVAPNARVWILKNMQKGLADEVIANVEMSVPGDDVDNAKLDKLGGTVSLKDVELRYWEPLPKLTKVAATSTFDANHFDVTVKSGEMGAIKLKPSHVDISGLSADDQIATIEAHLQGPAQETLKVLNLPPLHYADKMKVDPAAVSGTMEGVLKTSFPLISALLLEQMNISADVNLKNLGISKIVDFLAITDGSVTLGVNTQALSIDGEAAINGVPAHVSWDEKFSGAGDGPLSHGVAHANTGAESAARFGLEFAVKSDPMPIVVTYDRYPNLSRLSVGAEAKTVALDIPDIGYHKPPGAPANIQVALEWGGGTPPRLSKINLEGANLNVKGQGNFDSTGKKLQKLTLDPFVAGKSKARIDFVRGADNIPQWTVAGEALDIQGFLLPPPEEKHVIQQVQDAKPKVENTITPLRLDIQVGKLITGEKTALGSTRVKGTRDTQGWSSLNVSTVAQGDTPFNLNISPAEGRTLLTAGTPNLGNVLQSLDVTDTMSGGKLEMDGKSEPNDALRTQFGHIKLANFHVREMPFLLRLLGAISPDAPDTLGRQSLQFDELTGEYVWSKEAFVFTKASTATGTLGLTASGRVDLVRDRIDLEGQVIPVYFISRILSAIPVIGDILTGGGDHGLFAATYQVRGPLAKPEVSVNPVAVLAPGIIRDILFTDPNITKEKKP